MEETKNGRWTPLKLGRNSTAFSHLLFVDDLIPMGMPCLNFVMSWKKMVHTFCKIFGQKVNLYTSHKLCSIKTCQTKTLTSWVGFDVWRKWRTSLITCVPLWVYTSHLQNHSNLLWIILCKNLWVGEWSFFLWLVRLS